MLFQRIVRENPIEKMMFEQENLKEMWLQAMRMFQTAYRSLR
jgi:hypothetical protein